MTDPPLPSDSAPPRDAPGADVRAPPTHRRRVLVVDDNHDAAQSIGALLEMAGHTVRLAHDGPSAVARAGEFWPEVILMDLGLPGFDGLVATRQIRLLAFSARPTIVALTGWGSAADRASTRAAGCDLHLVKPVDYREIAKALDFVAPDTKEAP